MKFDPCRLPLLVVAASATLKTASAQKVEFVACEYDHEGSTNLVAMWDGKLNDLSALGPKRSNTYYDGGQGLIRFGSWIVGIMGGAWDEYTDSSKILPLMDVFQSTGGGPDPVGIVQGSNSLFIQNDGRVILPSGYQPGQKLSGSFCAPGTSFSQIDNVQNRVSWTAPNGELQEIIFRTDKGNCLKPPTPEMCDPDYVPPPPTPPGKVEMVICEYPHSDGTDLVAIWDGKLNDLSALTFNELFWDDEKDESYGNLRAQSWIMGVVGEYQDSYDGVNALFELENPSSAWSSPPNGFIQGDAGLWIGPTSKQVFLPPGYIAGDDMSGSFCAQVKAFVGDDWVLKDQVQNRVSWTAPDGALQEIVFRTDKNNCLKPPTPEMCGRTSPKDGAMIDDPHIKIWGKGWIDYQGECDLVLLHAPDFEPGVPLYIHVRTVARYVYSYIESAVIQIGEDLLQVNSWGDYYYQYVNNGALDGADLAGFPIYYSKPNEKQHIFDILIGKDEYISITTFKDMVSVKIHQGTFEHFRNSTGIMGSFSGDLMGRNGTEFQLEDANAFGQEWQVLETEPMLFQTVRAPQAPTEQCKLPSAAAQEKRRLGTPSISHEEASKACAHLKNDQDRMNACIYDVKAVGDLDIAEAGAY